ncbi:nucleoside diphosphate kinase homolog 7 [Onthophagus taurus]|uniref:nucleoside diphosphate kinase homolog 7 n=1 Tax=Onthophagus taurus TaxID=166361 RepID=UPI000C20F37F|nr:nucleoside diphosphate kinase 7 [Onthophagus taurus]XP_022911299.1 nucleoside diphosphate kinase 7 [Onthophagus taurus]
MQVCNNEYDYTSKLCFKAQWYDYQTQYLKHFNLTYYPYDNTVELYDEDIQKIYLRRSASENIAMKDFYIGNTVRIYGRQIELVEYGDEFTKKLISKSKQHTFLLIKPSMADRLGVVVNEIQDRNFQICKMRMANMTRREALDFYESKKGDVFLPFQIEHIISGSVVGVEVVGLNAIERWNEILGPDDPVEARKTHPESLRAIYGESKATNAFHCAQDAEAAEKESNYFFPKGPRTLPPNPTILLKNTTCCIIKPHVIYQGNLGNLITSIQDNKLFKITALRMINFSTPDCEEFLEVYKGVIADFNALFFSYLDGFCVALEIAGRQDDINVHEEFRQFTGPIHSNVAKQIRPMSLRALYGIDKYKNAVHCTDLPEDTQLELEYVFKILDC